MERSETSVSTQQAGWHPDPHVEGRQRYWDGEGWTTQTRWPTEEELAATEAASEDADGQPAANVDQEEPAGTAPSTSEPAGESSTEAVPAAAPTPTPTGSTPSSPSAPPSRPAGKRPKTKVLALGALVAVLAVGLTALVGGLLRSDDVPSIAIADVDGDAAASEEPSEAPDDEPTDADDDESQGETEAEETEPEVLTRVPDVVGDDIEDAQARLEDMGFAVSTSESTNAGFPGEVLEQDPQPGVELPSGDTVQLSHAAAADMPDLIGSMLDEAQEALESYGVRVTSSKLYDKTTEPGTVVEQIPSPGLPIERQAELVVADGPASLPLRRIDYVDATNVQWVETVGMDGTTYLRNIGTYYLDASRSHRTTAYVEFNLSRDFDTLQTVLGFDDNAPSSAIVRAEIFADGQKLEEHDLRLGTAIPLEIDIRDVLRLRVEWTALEGEPTSLLGDPQLLGDPEVIQRYERAATDD
jgi:hypothetical protein